MTAGLVAIRTSQPVSECSCGRYSDTLISYQGQGPEQRSPRRAQSRLHKHGDPDDAIERASRILAKAFGYGDSWFTADLQFGQDETSHTDGAPDVKRTDGLPIARRTETLEKADKAANVGEFHHWQRAKGIGVTPRVRPKRTALAALAFAKLDGPLEDWLLMYALQDWTRWARVRRFALAVRPDEPALEDAVQRVLFRVASVSQDARARDLGIRASTYRARTVAAEEMLREWLARAANAVLNAMSDR